MNDQIRKSIEISGLKYWQVAEAVGVADTTLSKWLRHELSDDRRREILKAIDRLKKNGG